MQVQNLCKVCPVCKAGIDEDKVSLHVTLQNTHIAEYPQRYVPHKVYSWSISHTRAQQLLTLCARWFLFMAEGERTRILGASTKSQRDRRTRKVTTLFPGDLLGRGLLLQT